MHLNTFKILFAYLNSLLLAFYILLSSNRYQVIIVDQLSVSIPILRLTGAKILFYGHFPDLLLTNRRSWLKALYRLPFDYIEELTTYLSDKIVVNSKFTRDTFVSTFKSLNRHQIDVLYPGIRLDDYDIVPSKKDPSVLPLLILGSFVLSINRFERKKDLQLAIHSFASLSQKYPKVKLVLAGGYDPRVSENVEHLQELTELCRQSQLDSVVLWKKEDRVPDSTRVVFIPSFTNSQRQFLLQNAISLIYTPSNEHFGITPIEGMYASLPVVACKSGGPVESIVDKRFGFLVESSVGEFTTALNKILQDYDQKDNEKNKKIGKAARKRVIDNFSLANFINRLESHLEELAIKKTL